MKLIDIVGKRFGRLLVLSHVGIHRLGKKGIVRHVYKCLCDCGNKKIILGPSLRTGATVSCGCYNKEQARKTMLMRSESSAKLSQTPQYVLYYGAKHRAKKTGLPFNLTPKDIVIPEFCPVLGMKLQECVGKKGPGDSSPSVDKIIPSLGYVKGNVRVISYRANAIKRDASAEELYKVLAYVERETGKEAALMHQ